MDENLTATVYITEVTFLIDYRRARRAGYVRTSEKKKKEKGKDGKR